MLKAIHGESQIMRVSAIHTFPDFSFFGLISRISMKQAMPQLRHRLVFFVLCVIYSLFFRMSVASSSIRKAASRTSMIMS